MSFNGKLHAADCEVTFYTAGGPGGQHRNKSATAVRILHRPTGITVTATERRSQSQNREMAWSRLKEKLQKLQHKPKKRVATKASRSSKERRLEAKRRNATHKANRRVGDW
jgi:ribosome-associated protein